MKILLIIILWIILDCLMLIIFGGMASVGKTPEEKAFEDEEQARWVAENVHGEL